jgi:hypothetical protein
MAQALLQMDAATKAGQAKSNSLVFNTFIFMQVHTSGLLLRGMCFAWLRRHTLPREAEGIQGTPKTQEQGLARVLLAGVEHAARPPD